MAKLTIGSLLYIITGVYTIICFISSILNLTFNTYYTKLLIIISSVIYIPLLFTILYLSNSDNTGVDLLNLTVYSLYGVHI